MAQAWIFFSWFRRGDSPWRNWWRKVTFNRTLDAALRSVGIEGATCLPATGIWERQREPARLLIVYASDEKVARLVSELKRRFGQEFIFIDGDGGPRLV
jgi:hypothetical protein